MGEVRACVYLSVIFLCFQVSFSKPFFGNRFWCDLFCEDTDDVSTTATSSEDYFDSWCDDCPTRRPRPVTTMMSPVNPNPGVPGAPGVPGMPPGPPPVNYFMMNPSQGGGMNFGMVPDPNRGWYFNILPWNPAGAPAGPGGPPPNATPAPAPAPITAAGAPNPTNAPGAPAPGAPAPGAPAPGAPAPGAPAQGATTPAAAGAATTAAPAAARK